MRRTFIGLIAACAALALPAGAAEQVNLSIATGGTGGVYYPLGGGMANVFSKHIPGMQATATRWPGWRRRFTVFSPTSPTASWRGRCAA